MTLPRPEYPRPQFVRDDWLCLNGPWQFEIDPGDSGLERGLLDRDLTGEILVPFCPESQLSGIGNTDFLNAVWYRREVAFPADWAGRRILLHFQAVDYDATVWADGVEVARHRGGFTPFTCDLGDAGGRTVTLVVRARDNHRRNQPKGKQSDRVENFGCHYTRTTGIWQTVWAEPVCQFAHFQRPRITPDVDEGRFLITLPIAGQRFDLAFFATICDGRGEIARVSHDTSSDLTPTVVLDIPPDRRRTWSPDDPFLYDLSFELCDPGGNVLDRVGSYAGLRGVSIDGPTVLLNGQPVFQRLVLDQGYWPDGIMTAPNDTALARDIELSMAAGFNGARLHQKVFEERFLYHADRLGYLVWGEFADWSGGRPAGRPGLPVVAQWIEALARDFSHPSIVGWCPLNETSSPLTDRTDELTDLTRALFLATKAADATRPVLDASGYAHRVAEADIYDSHDYTQDPDEFAARHAGLASGEPFVNRRDGGPISLPWAGQPYFVSEFGGTWWNPEAAEDDGSWGYGDRPKTVEEFYGRFERLTGVLLDSPRMFGYCWTQLTDVFQEQNGIYHFDRRPKFDADRLRAIQQRPAAIETSHGDTRD